MTEKLRIFDTEFDNSPISDTRTRPNHFDFSDKDFSSVFMIRILLFQWWACYWVLIIGIIRLSGWRWFIQDNVEPSKLELLVSFKIKPFSVISILLRKIFWLFGKRWGTYRLQQIFWKNSQNENISKPYQNNFRSKISWRHASSQLNSVIIFVKIMDPILDVASVKVTTPSVPKISRSSRWEPLTNILFSGDKWSRRKMFEKIV